MQDKQKVTLYIPPSLHRKLKIKAAVDMESMSGLVEKAIAFYLDNPEIVEEVETSNHGKTHQVRICPECETAMVERNGKMVSLGKQPGVLTEELEVEVGNVVSARNSAESEELVPCYTR